MKPKSIFIFIFLIHSIFSTLILAGQSAPDDISSKNSSKNSIIELRWSAKEVKDISNILSGKVFLYNDASERRFKEQAPNANIIHLATHAIIDDQAPLYSKLFFSNTKDSSEDGYLHTYELYNMNLNTSLAVLSACNTGTGKLVRGEGMMSLARSFMYAGCPNVIFTLWPVDDKSTASIMKHFYQEIIHGVNKDEALRNAKLTFLQNADEVKSNPYYWAGFIMVGDSKPVQLISETNKLLWFLIPLLLFILIILFRNRIFFRRNKAMILFSILILPFFIIFFYLYQQDTASQKKVKKIDTHTEISSKYFFKAEKLQNEAQFDSSIFYFEQAGAIFKQLNNWIEYINCVNNIGENLRRKGEHEKALTYLQTALDTALQKFDENHPVIAKLYNTFGDVYRKKGDIETAFDYFQKSLIILQKKPNDAPLEFARSYHGMGVIYYYKGDYDKAIDLHKKSLSIRREILGEHHPLIADNYVNLGINFSKKGNYERAVEYYHKALSTRIKELGENHPDIANSYLNLGVVYLEMGDYENALKNYNKALQITQQTLGNNHPSIAGNYLNIGLIFDKKGDYDKALEYYYKSLSMTIKIFGDDHPLVAENYNNIGIIYKKMAAYERALEFYNKALSAYFKRVGQNHPDVIKTYLNIANVYSLKNNNDNAIEFYQKALSIVYKIFGDVHPLLAIIYNNLGIVNLTQGNFEKAFEFFQEGLLIAQEVFGEKHPLLAELYQQIGEAYSNQQNYEKALEYFQKAIIALISDFENHNIYMNPELKNISEETRLLSVLALKASAFKKLYLTKTNEIQDIRFAMSTYELALLLIDNISKCYKAENSKLFLKERVHGIYSQAIQTAYDLYKLTDKTDDKEQAFLFSEKSKASVLRQALLDYKAKQFAGIPDSLLEKERQLKVDLAFYDKNLFDEAKKDGAGDSLKVNLWQDKLFTLKRNYENLINRFENEYPEYYRLKYQMAIIYPQKLQAEIMDEQSAIVEYYIGDSSLFIFTITQQDFDVTHVVKDSLFEQRIELMRSGLINKDYYQYTKNAFELYKKLIAPIESKIKDKHLVIIPDGIVGYIPFETLLSKDVSENRNDYRTLPYLIRNYQIAYNYSSSLLFENITKEKNSRFKTNYIGFAPVVFE